VSFKKLIKQRKSKFNSQIQMSVCSFLNRVPVVQIRLGAWKKPQWKRGFLLFQGSWVLMFLMSWWRNWWQSFS